MIKGRTIQTIQSEIERFGSKSSIISSSSGSVILNSKKIISSTAGVDPTYSTVLPKIKSSKVISSINELELEKTVIKNIKVQNEVINKTQNIRYNINELKLKFPGYNALFYTEIFDLLQSTDFELSDSNLTSNIQKFIHLGNNIQSQISRLHNNLEILSEQSFDKIKEKAHDRISGIFSNDNKLETSFIQFNIEITEYRDILYKETQKLKNIDFNKMNIINLYFDFFLFISDELQNKNLTDTSGIIQSRVISLSNSKTVLEQFKNLVQIEIQGKEIQYNNIKNYLDIILPSLYLLRKQNYKEFKVNFKNFIKI